MRIKHFAGYGCVNASKVSRSFNTATKQRTMVIEVSGNHEYGLDRHWDKYDCYNWLLKRFDKQLPVNFSYHNIESIGYEEFHDRKDSNGCYLDTAQYTFTYSY